MPFALLVALTSFAVQTDLTFVRHGETIANKTGVYNSKTLNVLSPEGEAGVAKLTQRLLKEPKFDRILVSPSPRALKTIAPYLKATHTKAIVWPLLYECCTGRRPKNARATSYSYGPTITLPKDLAPYFRIDPNHDRLPNAPDYNAGLAQANASVAEFKKLYAGGRVLVVGHSGHGGQFLYGFTGKRYHVKNTTEIRIQIP